ncbi:MAG: zinc-binding dehydrogenase [Clostridia bacterium]|nr:zinc-binding dehydrogenase [Clostridia bacterium]MDE7329417.1 zinc-binding dehydrogenase [Clostridia bacterium]
MKSYKITKNFSIEPETEEGSYNLKHFAKIKITRAGICSSDVAIFSGSMNETGLPLRPARTAVGLVSESDDFTLRKGQRVMLSPYTRLENNKFQVNGLKNDGYLADYVYAPLSNIYTVPLGISDDAFTFIEDIAMAIKVIEQLDIDKTKYVMLFGCTSVNMIIAQLCFYYQAIPIIIDNDNTRIALAQELGAYYCVNYVEEDVLQKLREITSGKLVDYLILDSDICEEVGRMLSYVRHNGKVAIVGYNTSKVALKGDFSPIVNNNLQIYGISDGYGEIEAAINMLATGTVKVDSLIEQIVDISEAQNTFSALAKKSNYLKTIFKC